MGESVAKGESLCRIHANATEHLEEARTLLASSFTIDNDHAEPAALIKERIKDFNVSH
jgi:thymidine phosphorylase